MMDVFEHLGPMDDVPMTRRSVTTAPPVWVDEDDIETEQTTAPLVVPMVGMATATAARDVRPRSNTSCVPPSSGRRYDGDSGYFSGPRSMPSSPQDTEMPVLGMDAPPEQADTATDSAFSSINDKNDGGAMATCPGPFIREQAEDLETLVATVDPHIPLAGPDTFSIKFERMAVSAPPKPTSLMARLFEEEREVAAMAAARTVARRPLATPSSSLPARPSMMPSRSTHRYKPFSDNRTAAHHSVMFA